MVWKTTEPPKDMSTFLADVGLPFPVVAAWNDCDQCFVYASFSCNMVDGVYNDTYFETEQEKTVKRWMTLPDLP